MNFDKIIMNPPYTAKVKDGGKAFRPLDFPIYKIACEHGKDVVCLMRRSQKNKRNGNYTGYSENDIVFDEVSVDVAIFEHFKDRPLITIKSRYEENGKYDWLREHDLTSQYKTTLWHLIDRDWDKFKKLTVVPENYVALNEVSYKNFTVFTEGETPHKKDGSPLNCLIYIKTSDSKSMKDWLLKEVNPAHNEFRRFGDVHIDRGFSKTVLVPDYLVPKEFNSVL